MIGEIKESESIVPDEGKDPAVKFGKLDMSRTMACTSPHVAAFAVVGLPPLGTLSSSPASPFFLRSAVGHSLGPQVVACFTRTQLQHCCCTPCLHLVPVPGPPQGSIIGYSLASVLALARAGPAPATVLYAVPGRVQPLEFVPGSLSILALDPANTFLFVSQNSEAAVPDAVAEGTAKPTSMTGAVPKKGGTKPTAAVASPSTTNATRCSVALTSCVAKGRG
jgi:hypothetical protein